MKFERVLFGDMQADRQTNRHRHTDTLITILRVPNGGEVVIGIQATLDFLQASKIMVKLLRLKCRIPPICSCQTPFTLIMSQSPLPPPVPAIGML